MPEIRTDVWIRNATSAEVFLDYLGKHLVALPFGREEDKVGGQFVVLDPAAETLSLRNYATGAITELPWFTTHFRYSTYIESPFTGLAVGMVRRFEWHHDRNGNPLVLPTSHLGTVDKVTDTYIDLWVRDASYQAGGWSGRINASDAARHSVRAPHLKNPSE
ncbi:hypothetical protein [Streptomyces sp. MMBL 11-1]|uniref:hypothetical protein n=1 Tax=Streptomyces sp. MMBL 11-1 TaxID=3026420 RepID=UPI00235FD277|nr:hypothetical protein [Streptomyces sp. MMBL 11-1]